MKILPCGVAVVDTDTTHSTWISIAGRIDHDRCLDRMTMIKPGDWIVDAGANIGTHTVPYAQKVGPDGRVLAFEPHAGCFRCLVYNTRLPDRDTIPGHTFVECHNYALGMEYNFGAMLIDPTNPGASHLIKDADGEYEIRPLDAISLRRLDFFKIDVEGSEVDVIYGALKTIARCRPILFVEVNEGALVRQGQTGKALIELIRHLGYSIENMFPGHPMEGPQFDVIAKPL